MKRAEAEKLLGGYATGTLTEAEQRSLFEAALADQELFDLLADEEALRELLAEPRVRRRLLDALAEQKAGVWQRWLEWWRRPVAWGVAGSVAVAALLVVMLAPIYQMRKRPVVQPVAQAPVEVAKKAEPPVAPPPAAAPRPQRGRAAEPQRSVAAAPVQAEEKQAIAEAEAKPRLEAAPGGVVGGVVGGIVAPAPQVAAAPPMAALEADARALYYGPAEARRDIAPSALRAKRVSAEAAASKGAATPGLRYALLKMTASGAYDEVAPDTVFTAGDLIRLSVEANQSGILRLSRQDAAGRWNQLAELRVEARVRQVIPAEGLRLEASETLALEWTRGEGVAAAAMPLVERVAGERAVYVVAAGGGPQVRAGIQLTVR